MVTDHRPPSAPQDAPRPWDLVVLRPGNRGGIAPGVPLLVADTAGAAPGMIEVNHQEDHPAYWDWAAHVRADDIALIIRTTPHALHTWAPTTPTAPVPAAAAPDKEPIVITVDGRELVSRADLHEQYGYAHSALERWWARREENGHPDIAHQIGNTYFWDAQEWAAWDRKRLNPQSPPGMVSRAELMEKHRISRSALDQLWADRADNGHPEGTRIGGTLYWDAEEWDTWYAGYAEQRDKGRTWSPKAPAASGTDGTDPDELIIAAEFARILRHRHSDWVAHSAHEPPPGFPEPDEWQELPSGRQRPKWQRRRAQAYADTRHLRAPARPGRRAGSRNRPPYPYYGDPRLDLARRLLAEFPEERNARIIERLQQQSATSASRSTWTKIITSARRHPED